MNDKWYAFAGVIVAALLWQTLLPYIGLIVLGLILLAAVPLIIEPMRRMVVRILIAYGSMLILLFFAALIQWLKH